MKKITNQESLQEQIKVGMKELSSIVGKTLGPGGLPILLERVGLDAAHRPLKPLATKDGVTVARNVQVKDGVLNTIISSVIEVAEKTNIEAGDGTTTAIILANALYEKGLKMIAMGERPEAIYKAIGQTTEKIIKELEEMAIPVDSVEMIKSVATISANGEEEVGEVVGSAFDQVGEEGVITLQEGYDAHTRLKVESGFQIKRGLIRPEAFYTDPGAGECVLNNVAIIIYDGIIDDEKYLTPIMEQITHNWQERNAFLIIAQDIKGACLNTLVVNRMEERLTNFAMIKAPHVGHIKTEMLKDIAVATGGKMIIPDQDNLPSRLEGASIEDLGFARRIVLNKYSTLIYEGKGEDQEILDKVDELRKLRGKAESPYDSQIIDERIASLTGGIAVIHVGGKTELEMKEKKDRIEDALNATRAAIQGGIVVGGGAALFHISEQMKGKDIGSIIMKEVIREPMRQMLRNIGEDEKFIMSSISATSQEGENKLIGYDGAQKKICNLIENNVIDPVKVTKTALTNAISIANLLLTCGGAITIDREENKTEVSNNMML